SDIGVQDDFFTLGGDSIKAIQVMAALGLETKDLFLHPTIATLANRIETGTKRATNQETITGIVPLTAIQSWFFQEYPLDHHHFNHAETFFFQEPLDEAALQAALEAVQTHHDLLRARFSVNRVQEIAGLDYPVDFMVVDLRANRQSEQEIDRLTKELQSGLDLARGPLFKTRLFRLDNEDRLLIVIHHLIIDALSWRFLLDDILRGYEQKIAGLTITLPPKSGSFQRWAKGVQTYSRSLRLLRELAYWQQVDATTVDLIPYSYPQPDHPTPEIQDQNITFSIIETEKLLQAIAPVPILDILLASLAQSLQILFKLEQIPIMLEGHGREPIVDDVDVSRTVGWFTSVFPVILSVLPGQTTLQVREAIRDRLNRIPNHGIGYGLLRYITPASMKAGMKFCLQPQISFNYLGEYRFDPGTLSLKATSDMAPYRVSDRVGTLYDLTFNAIVEGRQLQIFLAYDAKRFDPATIRSLLDTMYSLLNKNQGVL
ncbi:MAG: hypothetical protein HQL94_08620, partial [Magnetococcales bacterium]|nr:hypothetical protein [Magnetococcales bacterium]